MLRAPRLRGAFKTLLSIRLPRANYSIPCVRIANRLYHNGNTYLEQRFPVIPDIERVLKDPEVTEMCFHRLRKMESLPKRDLDWLHLLFVRAIDMATSDLSDEAYLFVIGAWESVFFGDNASAQESEALAPMYAKFLSCKDKVIHLTMNRGDYSAYESLIRPLHSRKAYALERSFADTLASTLQLQLDLDGVLQVNTKAIKLFLKSTNTPEKKRALLLTYVRKALLTGNRSDSVSIALNFANFLRDMGEVDFLFDQKDDARFSKALRLIATPPPGVQADSHIQRLHNALIEANIDVSNFLTALARSVLATNPKMAISIWNFKAKDDFPGERNAEDLLIVMKALLAEKRYDGVVEAYGTNPRLQSNDQIETILRVSEECKNWKLLQAQFEDMYGRGQLPYVVHYSVVMGALANIGVTKEVEELYEQLLRRKLSPNYHIFAALVKSKLNVNDLEGANSWYQVFLQHVNDGSIEEKYLPRMRILLFESKLLELSLSDAMHEIHDILDAQKKARIVLVDSSFFCRVLNFLSSAYAVKEFEEVFGIARDLDLLNDAVYSSAISTLTAFGQYERANELSFEAHVESSVPFSNSLVVGAQLKNYRAWMKVTTSSAMRRHIEYRIQSLLSRLDRGTISPNNIYRVYLEAIKYYTEKGDATKAMIYLEKAKTLQVCSEAHYLPFIKFNAKKGEFANNSEILKLYREMAKEKVTITARTYRFLIGALIKIDKANNNRLANSYKLLQSVLELYGFSVQKSSQRSKLPSDEISRSAVDLLALVSEYALVARAEAHAGGMELVVNFLSQIRSKLERKVTFEFRVSILRDMSRLYLAYGDIGNSSSLIKLAFKELWDVIDHHRETAARDNEFVEVPKLLQLDYRKLADVQMSIFTVQKPLFEDVQEVLSEALSRNVRLSGRQLNLLCSNLLAFKHSEELLKLVLGMCERFLVTGNWIELKLQRRVLYIYKLFLLDLSTTIDAAHLFEKFKLLNAYYKVSSFSDLVAELSYVRTPHLTLQKALHEYSSLVRETWTLENLSTDLASIFAPGHKIASTNIIGTGLASRLIAAVEKECDGSMESAFDLYDQFPETIEFLLIFAERRIRFELFRRSLGVGHGSGETQRAQIVEKLQPIINT